MPEQIIAAKDVPFAWFRKELTFQSTAKKGSRGKRVKFIQECLNLQGFKTPVDSDFGVATQRVVQTYQAARKLTITGTANKATFASLIAPFLRALTPIKGEEQHNLLVIAYAKKHLKEHPVEVGGPNCGPWVRLYMNGNEGKAWPWCAGFVTLVIQQAAKFHGFKSNVGRTFSCDVLAERAKNSNHFLPEKWAGEGGDPSKLIAPGSIFLNRRSKIDWTHTGFVLQADKKTFTTIEGNTNDDGSREGYEVCTNTRGYSKRDFIIY